MKPTAIAAILLALVACSREEPESVEERADTVAAELENRANAIEAEAENGVDVTVEQLDQEFTDPAGHDGNAAGNRAAE